MSENSSESKNSRVLPIVPALCNKYSAAAIIMTIAAALTFVIGGGDHNCLFNMSACAVMLTAFYTMEYFFLGKRQLTVEDIKQHAKSIDSRLYGNLSDISGVGSTFGVFAGIITAFSEMYIRDGGIFEREDFAAAFIASLTDAVLTAVIITAVTSKKGLIRSVYIICARSFGLSGKELLNKVSRVQHYENVFARIRLMAAVRLSAAIAAAVTILISSGCGAGSPYSCAGLAVVFGTVLLVTELCPKGDAAEDKACEEKLVLWDKKSKSACAVNIISFVLIAFAFLFTFPFRSVYTDYTPQSNYYYFDEYEEYSTEIISAPVPDENNASMFTGILLITAALPCVMAVALSTKRNKDNTDVSVHFLPSVISLAVFAAGILMAGFVFTEYSFDFVRWIAAISVICLMVLINLIHVMICVNPTSNSSNSK